MNAIASLLQRAVAEIADAPKVAAIEEPFAFGSLVKLCTTGVDELDGRVAFEDGDWIHWAAVDGSFHATKREALREMTR